MSIRLIYVVTWRYYDGSAVGVVAAHGTKGGAEHMAAILRQHSDGMKVFEIAQTPYED